MDMSVWYLMGAALVFFMQCGFAMVEAGFTRAKNVGNITMKNLMDFCIGTVAFYLLGYNLLCGEGGFVGWGLNPFTGFGETDWSAFVFNLVFCATAATIVSGAMAERTKFITYCIYSFIISLVVYPVEAHWVWGATPWLTDMGFTDFAGSACIHMVGGITAFIGAAMLGPRIGKYDKNGKARPILGHNILIGALGVFILWFGWYGFNGAAATDTMQLSQIFATTTVAPAVATVSAMIFTWIRNGKPDVSMSLNGSLAGLVAVTAGCANVDAIGSFIIGAVAGVLVCVAVYFIEDKLKVDDPVGAVAVHGCNGIWGTIAVGLFDYKDGLFYGGGVRLSGGQAQRLALARTLCHKRPVLILDDPFSALDRKTEEEVFANLRKFTADSIVILLSHRLYLFPEMDQVLWMEAGKVTAGTHEQILEKFPEYARLYEAQADGADAHSTQEGGLDHAEK